MELEKAKWEDVELLPYDLGISNITEVSNRAYFIMKRIAEMDMNAGNDVIGTDTRFIASEILGLIVYKNVDVGFIYATVEQRYRDALFLDMALLPNYRNMKIGSIATEKLINYFGKNNILIAETRKTNNVTNNVCPKHGAIIPINNSEFNYYVFPSEHLQEIDLERFEKAMSESEKTGSSRRK